MDKKFYYNSINLNRELHIAGSFIFDGLADIYNMNIDYSELDEPEFLVLYNLSVGVERLQKVTIVLNENFSSQEEIDESPYNRALKQHNHENLNQIINETASQDLKLSKNERKILEMLMRYYKICRYGNYNFDSRGDLTKELVFEELNAIFGTDKKQKYDRSNMFVHLEIKKLLFNLLSSVGLIFEKYVEKIRELMNENYLFTNESQSETKFYILNTYGRDIERYFIFREHSKYELYYYIFSQEIETDIEPIEYDMVMILEYINQINSNATCSALVGSTIFSLKEYFLDESEFLSENQRDEILDEDVFQYLQKYRIAEIRGQLYMKFEGDEF